MLRITTHHQDGRVVLRLEGRLHGPWVDELRNCWQRESESAGDEPIRIELIDVRFVDALGKALLTQMHRAGVEILAHGFFASAIREEIVRSIT